MSKCLVKQNDGTWVEKGQRFLFNVYKRYLFLSRFLRFLTFFIFFSGTVFKSMVWSGTTRRERADFADLVRLFHVQVRTPWFKWKSAYNTP